MIVLDASALLVFMFEEAGHEQVAGYLSDSCISSVNLLEVASRFSRNGLSPAPVLELIGSLGIRIVPFEEAHILTVAALGKEYGFHDQIREALAVETYFAHPYHSWERGLNENHNGLIRQYLPKGMPLDKVTQEDVQTIARKMNQRPRKLLGFKTPEEVYTQMAKAA